MFPSVLGKFLFFHISQFFAFDRNTSTICALDSTDNIQQGGFTGARRPQKYTEFPFFNIQVQPFQNIYFAVPGTK